MSGWLKGSCFPFHGKERSILNRGVELPPCQPPSPADPGPGGLPGKGACGGTHRLAVTDNAAHHPEGLPQVRVPRLLQSIEVPPEGAACGDPTTTHRRPRSPPGRGHPPAAAPDQPAPPRRPLRSRCRSQCRSRPAGDPGRNAGCQRKGGAGMRCTDGGAGGREGVPDAGRVTGCAAAACTGPGLRGAGKEGYRAGGSYLPPRRGSVAPCRAGWAGRAWGGRRGRAGAGAGAGRAAAAQRRAWCRPAGAGGPGPEAAAAGRGGRELPGAAAASARLPAPAPLYRRRHGQAGAASPVQTKAPLMRRRQRPAGGGCAPRRAPTPPHTPGPRARRPRLARDVLSRPVLWHPRHGAAPPGTGYPRARDVQGISLIHCSPSPRACGSPSAEHPYSYASPRAWGT